MACDLPAASIPRPPETAPWIAAAVSDFKPFTVTCPSFGVFPQDFHRTVYGLDDDDPNGTSALMLLGLEADGEGIPLGVVRYDEPIAVQVEDAHVEIPPAITSAGWRPETASRAPPSRFGPRAKAVRLRPEEIGPVRHAKTPSLAEPYGTSTRVTDSAATPTTHFEAFVSAATHAALAPSGPAERPAAHLAPVVRAATPTAAEESDMAVQWKVASRLGLSFIGSIDVAPHAHASSGGRIVSRSVPPRSTLSTAQQAKRRHNVAVHAASMMIALSEHGHLGSLTATSPSRQMPPPAPPLDMTQFRSYTPLNQSAASSAAPEGSDNDMRRRASRVAAFVETCRSNAAAVDAVRRGSTPLPQIRPASSGGDSAVRAAVRLLNQTPSVDGVVAADLVAVAAPIDVKGPRRHADKARLPLEHAMNSADLTFSCGDDGTGNSDHGDHTSLRFPTLRTPTPTRAVSALGVSRPATSMSQQRASMQVVKTTNGHPRRPLRPDGRMQPLLRASN
jgi:hypothetical protein